jgi:hypothetical protein
MSKLTVFYPVGGPGSDEELKYSLRALDKNLLMDYEVVIYSDHTIDWLQHVTFKVFDRYYPVQTDYKIYETYWDSTSKLFNFVKNNNCGNFLYHYDDCCLIKPTESISVFDMVVLDRIDKYAHKDMEGSRHGRTILKAVELLPNTVVLNAETHCPRVFHSELLLDVFTKFDYFSKNIPPAISTLYYNYYYAGEFKILAEHNDLRASFSFEDFDNTGSYMAFKESDIAKYSEGKRILHWNNKMWGYHRNGSYPLRNHLEKLFPNKSRYEKD